MHMVRLQPCTVTTPHTFRFNQGRSLRNGARMIRGTTCFAQRRSKTCPGMVCAGCCESCSTHGLPHLEGDAAQSLNMTQISRYLMVVQLAPGPGVKTVMIKPACRT